MGIRVDDNANHLEWVLLLHGNQLTSYSAGANGASYEPRGDRFTKGCSSYDGTNNKTDDGLIVGVALNKNVGIVSFFARMEHYYQMAQCPSGIECFIGCSYSRIFTYNDGSNVDNTYQLRSKPNLLRKVTAGT